MRLIDAKNERPQGKWEECEWKEYELKGNAVFGRGYWCKCGRIVFQRENYCPNCGADMRGSKDADQEV